METTYKKGEVVKIFQEPLTKGCYEGDARLVEYHHSAGSLEYWTVDFGDGELYERFIRVD